MPADTPALTPPTAPSTAGAASDPGPRIANEDAYLCAPEAGWYLVADGVGGPGKGDRASAHVRDAFEAASRAAGALEDRVAQAFQQANRAIVRDVLEDPSLKGMGSTATLAVVGDGVVRIWHVGDSRVLLLRDGQARALTDDHTLAAQLVKLKQLAPDQIATHPSRHTLLRCLGKESAIRQDVSTHDLKQGDRLVLCSDGLHAFLANPRIAELGGAGKPGEAAAALLEAALRNGAADNVTAVVVECAVAAPQAASAPTAELEGWLFELLPVAAAGEGSSTTERAGRLLDSAVRTLGANRAFLVATDHDEPLGVRTQAGAPALLPRAQAVHWTEALRVGKPSWTPVSGSGGPSVLGCVPTGAPGVVLVVDGPGVPSQPEPAQVSAARVIAALLGALSAGLVADRALEAVASGRRAVAAVARAAASKDPLDGVVRALQAALGSGDVWVLDASLQGLAGPAEVPPQAREQARLAAEAGHAVLDLGGPSSPSTLVSVIGFSLEAHVAAPLYVNGETVGSVVAVFDAARQVPPTEAHRQMMDELAPMVALGVVARKLAAPAAAADGATDGALVPVRLDEAPAAEDYAPDAWQVFQAVDGVRDVDALARHVGRPVSEVHGVVKALTAKGVLYCRKG